MPTGPSVAITSSQLSRGHAHGQHPVLDLTSLEGLVQSFFARGIAQNTIKSYSSAQKHYLSFCLHYHIPPLPLSELSSCLFAAFLAHQGLKSQSISSYLSAVWHLQISAGLEPPQRATWPRLQYVLKGIARSQPNAAKHCLPITANIMLQILTTSWVVFTDEFECRLLWAACCLGYYGFMRSDEFTTTSSSTPAILATDLAVDSHESPSVVKVTLRRAKTDPFGKGVDIFFGRTNTPTCPVQALLQYMAIRPKDDSCCPLLVHANVSPLSRDQFVHMVKKTLRAAKIDDSAYSGHSFRVGAASAAAAARIPVYFIKILGRWESEAYHLYIRTPRASLAAISQLIAM